jgi:hypothetical protein
MVFGEVKEAGQKVDYSHLEHSQTFPSFSKINKINCNEEYRELIKVLLVHNEHLG